MSVGEFQPVRLACSHGPDLHFGGKLVGSYTTQNKAGTKRRWTELRLWETPAGNWIAEKVGCSSEQGEGEIREAVVIDCGASFIAGGGIEARGMNLREKQDCIDEAMGVWGWSTAAKAFARELGWDVIRRVD